MASQFDDLFSRFAKLPEAKRREMDQALSFMETARMPTEQGAKHRGMLAQQNIDPENVRLLGAYAAYRYGLQHEPMDRRHAQLMRMQGVPDEKIAQMDSREKWEGDQLGRFAPLMQLVQDVKPKPDMEMQPEEITASVPKKAAKAKPKPAPVPIPAPAPMPMGAPAAAPVFAPAPQQGPLLAAPPPSAPVGPGAAPLDPRIGQLEQERMPLAVQLGGQYA